MMQVDTRCDTRMGWCSARHQQGVTAGPGRGVPTQPGEGPQHSPDAALSRQRPRGEEGFRQTTRAGDAGPLEAAPRGGSGTLPRGSGAIPARGGALRASTLGARRPKGRPSTPGAETRKPKMGTCGPEAATCGPDVGTCGPDVGRVNTGRISPAGLRPRTPPLTGWHDVRERPTRRARVADSTYANGRLGVREWRTRAHTPDRPPTTLSRRGRSTAGRGAAPHPAH